MVLAKPQPFNRTCGAASKSFVGQILLHAATSPDQFPTNSSKVAFARVVFEKFLDDFRFSFFDQNHQHHAEVALQSLRQTGTVLAYTQEFNSHAPTVGWADTPLMSLCQHGLKENVQLTVVMSNIEFTSLQTMQAMALKAGQTIGGIQNGRPTPIPLASSSAPTTNPNAMDLSAFQRGGPHNQLSNAEHTGNVSHGCSNRNRKL
ncbi:uncharacterized protein VP01_3548g3 [Puccinia sorghi]|uniref:Retrotransposon gag domain-containing protein n=1 Tax=Puccinia sorghi TaxID=27349 RepID=A0A0L6UXD0_9BASI|nr:uncharacterized protein VP01_3548g3 [Puccinia sorghi]